MAISNAKSSTLVFNVVSSTLWLASTASDLGSSARKALSVSPSEINDASKASMSSSFLVLLSISVLLRGGIAEMSSSSRNRSGAFNPWSLSIRSEESDKSAKGVVVRVITTVDFLLKGL